MNEPVAAEIKRLVAARTAIEAAIADKGVTVPEDTAFEDLDELIESIQTEDNKIYLVGQKNILTQIRSFNETKASITQAAHRITFTKTSDSNGGSGVSCYFTIDLTNISKIVMDCEATNVRNTTNVNYLPHFGATDTYVTSLSNASYASSAYLCDAGVTSFDRKTVELDVSSLTGKYYISYQGVASLVIYGWYLE